MRRVVLLFRRHRVLDRRHQTRGTVTGKALSYRLLLLSLLLLVEPGRVGRGRGVTLKKTPSTLNESVGLDRGRVVSELRGGNVVGRGCAVRCRRRRRYVPVQLTRLRRLAADDRCVVLGWSELQVGGMMRKTRGIGHKFCELMVISIQTIVCILLRPRQATLTATTTTATTTTTITTTTTSTTLIQDGLMMLPGLEEHLLERVDVGRCTERPKHRHC